MNLLKYLVVFTVLICAKQLYARSELHIAIMPPPVRLDWSTPRSILWSTAKAFVFGGDDDFAIGHAVVKIQCENRTQWAGMDGADTEDVQELLLKKKAGLGLLFNDFSGQLENNQSIESYIYDVPREKISWIKIKINEENCQRLLNYHDEYERRGYGSHYGLANRPRYGEGAGCSAFVVSFLDIAGLLELEMAKSWSRRYRVPLALIGHEKNPVSLYSLATKKTRWARAHEAHRPLYFYDPELMFDWIHKQPARDLSKGLRHIGNTVYLDRVHVLPPQESFWIEK